MERVSFSEGKYTIDTYKDAINEILLSRLPHELTEMFDMFDHGSHKGPTPNATGETPKENIAGPYERGLLNGQLMGSTTAESFTIVGGFLKQPI